MTERICFVVMPFGDDRSDPEKHRLWTEFYEHLKGIVEGVGLRCIRADKICRPGNIIRDIVRHLATADIVIADLTDRNPNVFYELGVRHALASPTILLSQRGEDVPFDLRPYRLISYRFTPRGAEELAKQLRDYIREALEDSTEPDSPVHEYRSALSRVMNERSTEARSSVDLEREIEAIKSQNLRLASDLREVMSVVQLSSKHSNVTSIDLNGTWREVGTLFHQDTFIEDQEGVWVLAYRGRWPGCCWGSVEDWVLRFSWTRFDLSMSGNGYYRINDSLTRLEGGIWFDSTDPDVMLGQDTLLERHVLEKESVHLSREGRALLDRTHAFLAARGVF